MEQLTANVQRLVDLEVTNSAYVSRPLLRYLTKWLGSPVKDVSGLADALTDGLDVDFTGTQWESEWLADGKICQCKACKLARECLADIERII